MTTSQLSRYGFYYFPDVLHFTEPDLHKWIPELTALGASWLTLLAPTDRTVPELFIRRLIEAGIQPILHLPLSTTDPARPDELSLLLKAYARWGVNYVTLFDRPNLQANWSAPQWAKNNLVERFLDIFIPVGEIALEAGVIPVFSPLDPGGDYWDTAFLFTALQGIQRRGVNDLLQQLVLSAYAWPGNRSPNWGAGGPERWPRTRPYLTPAESEDHRGFRIFDWYLAIANAAIGKSCPIILLAAGSRIGDQPDPRSPAVDVHAHTWQNMTLVQMMSGRPQEDEPIPDEVITCNFWLLAAAQGAGQINDAWYKPDSSQLPVVQQLKKWVTEGREKEHSSAKASPPVSKYNPGTHPISHYLLLPNSEWGTAEWNLDAIRPFLQKYQPTIGFSPVEASHAKRVTVVGEASNISDSIIDGLLAAGCIVEQISGDGMNIASR